MSEESIPHVRGLERPRLATPRLGLSTKGKPAKNPYGANKMTISKQASIEQYYTHLLTKQAAEVPLSLREFYDLQQLEKNAGIVDRLIGAAGRAASNVGSRLSTVGSRVSASAASRAEASRLARMSPGEMLGEAMRSSSVVAPPSPVLKGAAPGKATAPVDTRLARSKPATPATSSTPASASTATPTSTPASTATPAPSATPTTPSTPTTPTPDASADDLLTRAVRYAPVGVVGGLTAYGGFRGWQKGQEEVRNSEQQGFNPATRF
jgi:hypothetical protein